MGLLLPYSPLDSLVSRKGSPRTLIMELVPCFSSEWYQSFQSLGFGAAPYHGKATAHGTQGPAFSSFP